MHVNIPDLRTSSFLNFRQNFMTKIQFDSPGNTQLTSVRVAKDITDQLLKQLSEYEEVLDELLKIPANEDNRELIYPMDYYEHLLSIYTHIQAHAQMLEQMVEWLDFGWSSKLSTALETEETPEI
jgi:hypothetical protein